MQTAEPFSSFRYCSGLQRGILQHAIQTAEKMGSSMCSAGRRRFRNDRSAKEKALVHLVGDGWGPGRPSRVGLGRAGRVDIGPRDGDTGMLCPPEILRSSEIFHATNL